MKKVSVVVPCYNVSAYLGRCVESLVKQTIGIENIEIILVDDASTDDGATWEVIMKYEEEYPNTIIAIPLEQNMRQGGARNIGITYASGEYLMFVDSDDWLALEAMEHAYQRAKEYDVDVVEYRMEKVTDDTDFSLLSPTEGSGSYLLELDKDERRKAYLITDNEGVPNCCTQKLYRLSMIKDKHIQFAEYLIYEEVLFTIPVRLYEERHYFLDEVLYFYYMSPGSTMRGVWDAPRLDNVLVWIHLVKDLEKRGFLQRYQEEIAYLFFCWGYVLTMVMVIRRGYALTVDVLEFFVNTMLRYFPDIRKNPYLLKETDGFRKLLREIFNMEISSDSILVINQNLADYLASASKGEPVENVQLKDIFTLHELLNELFRTGMSDEIIELLRSSKRLANDNLQALYYLIPVCEQEKAEGQRTLFEKVTSMDALIERYTKLRFYFRRIDLDIMDGNEEEFYQFLKQNQVSGYELFIVLHHSAIHREKVVQIVKEKLVKGEIEL